MNKEVTALLDKLEPNFLRAVNLLRTLILQTSPLISEHVKWNSPAYFYNGDMMPFNPKEYKRDIVVLNLRKQTILMVFPTGARIPKENSLLEGDYTDGRRMITLKNEEDIMAKSTQIQKVILQWLEGVE